MRYLLWVVIAAACGDQHPTPTGPTNMAGSQAKPEAPLSKASACDTLVVFVDQTGTWVGTPPDGLCFGIHANGAPDVAWLGNELDGLKTKLAAANCKPSIEIAADGVTYQEVVTVMDIAVRVGLVDTKFVDPDHMAMKLPPVMGGLPAAHCSGTLDTTHAAKPETPASPAAGGNVKDAPVVIVTTSELRLGDKTLVDVAAASKGQGVIPELEKALQDHPVKGLVILQADASTPATLINRIVVTAKRTGTDNVLFAVKNK